LSSDTKFEDCKKRGRIRNFSRGKALVPKELKLALFDYNSARESFKKQNYKWATIQTYYSMFHSARALLYDNNLREKSHFCLIEAMRALYVNNGVLSNNLIESLQKAKNLREDADYYGEFNVENARELLKKAKEFLKTVKGILKTKL